MVDGVAVVVTVFYLYGKRKMKELPNALFQLSDLRLSNQRTHLLL